ncbi:hypothetical protein BRC81_02390 [Halobacteriales archaeon QS_1_68_20]|nr:MAG: hypothetical protein BRC81_02390 [Halobacteriales archaeon QS_1_68_20]
MATEATFATRDSRPSLDHERVGAIFGLVVANEAAIERGMRSVEVQCGLQGSDEAAENARELIGEFLVAMDAVDGPVSRESTPLFRLTRP